MKFNKGVIALDCFSSGLNYWSTWGTGGKINQKQKQSYRTLLIFFHILGVICQKELCKRYCICDKIKPLKL